jgi:hypothetical protein
MYVSQLNINELQITIIQSHGEKGSFYTFTFTWQVEVVVEEFEKEDALSPFLVDFSLGNPLPEDPVLRDRETRQLTLRSVFVGSLFGILIGAANIYLGLKIGFGMGAGSFAALAGFAVLKGMEKKFKEGWGGGYFGPKENVSCQSAANGACSSGLFVAAYRLVEC